MRFIAVWIALAIVGLSTVAGTTAVSGRADEDVASAVTPEGYRIVRRHQQAKQRSLSEERHFELAGGIDDDPPTHQPTVAPGTRHSPFSISNDTLEPTATIISNDTREPTDAPSASPIVPSQAPVGEEEKDTESVEIGKDAIVVSIPQKDDGATLTLELGAVVAIGVAGILTPFFCGLVYLLVLCRGRQAKPEGEETGPQKGMYPDAMEAAAVVAAAKEYGFSADAAFKKCISCKASMDFTENSSLDVETPPPISTVYMRVPSTRKVLKEGSQGKDLDDSDHVASANPYIRKSSKNGLDMRDYEDGMPIDEEVAQDSLCLNEADSDNPNGFMESFSTYGQDSTCQHGADLSRGNILGAALTDDDEDFGLDEEMAISEESDECVSPDSSDEATFKISRLAL